MKQVYICCDHASEYFANKLYEKLAIICKPWSIFKDLKPGDRKEYQITRAIKESSFFIPLLSSSSLSEKSKFNKELNLAFQILDEFPEGHIFIIPILLDNDVKNLIPSKLNDIQSVNMFNNNIDDTSFKKLKEVIDDRIYLGRIERAEKIIDTIDQLKSKYDETEEKVVIRMRSAFTSMSNIKHYSGKIISDITTEKHKKKLDDLLVKERNNIIELLNLKNVYLKCICYPKQKRLKQDTYTEDEKKLRFYHLKKFIDNSIEEYLYSRQIVYDVSGSQGSILIFDKNIALFANPVSGGYKKSSVFTDLQTVQVLTDEYDKLFERILKNKINFYINSEDFNKVLLCEMLHYIEKELMIMGCE